MKTEFDRITDTGFAMTFQGCRYVIPFNGQVFTKDGEVTDRRTLSTLKEEIKKQAELILAITNNITE
jgi:hypothetical protein